MSSCPTILDILILDDSDVQTASCVSWGPGVTPMSPSFALHYPTLLARDGSGNSISS